MARLLFRRLLGMAVTLVLAAGVIFLVLEVLPGDPASTMLGVSANPETVASLRAELGLDRPAATRFLGWLFGLFTGDFGISYTYRVPVRGLIAERIAVTVPLATLALVLAAGIGIALGTLAASKASTAVDSAIMGLSQLGVAIPNFWFGILFVLLFSIGLGWFPSGGFPGWAAAPWGSLHALILPAFALALPQSAVLARVTRASMLETLSEDFIRTARAKGLDRGQVLRRHALRNALIPVVTLLGLQFSFLVAGTIVVENVFALPGLGRLLVQAVGGHDLILIRSLVLIFVGAVIATNAFVDIAYGLIDPRLRSSSR
jgi:peptide/nickel transport system permease protein